MLQRDTIAGILPGELSPAVEPHPRVELRVGDGQQRPDRVEVDERQRDCEDIPGGGPSIASRRSMFMSFFERGAHPPNTATSTISSRAAFHS